MQTLHFIWYFLCFSFYLFFPLRNEMNACMRKRQMFKIEINYIWKFSTSLPHYCLLFGFLARNFNKRQSSRQFLAFSCANGPKYHEHQHTHEEENKQKGIYNFVHYFCPIFYHTNTLSTNKNVRDVVVSSVRMSNVVVFSLSLFRNIYRELHENVCIINDWISVLDGWKI